MICEHAPEARLGQQDDAILVAGGGIVGRVEKAFMAQAALSFS
jgi:hypothetical protein